MSPVNEGEKRVERFFGRIKTRNEKQLCRKPTRMVVFKQNKTQFVPSLILISIDIRCVLKIGYTFQ
jgi:hypothetical protein